jgi:hypothetical protein
MSVAFVGAAVVGIAGAAISANSANKASKRAAEGQDAALAFEQEKYDDWQGTYGPLQDNLASYYNSLSAESYAAMGLENSQQAFETSMGRINESLAQRGITNTAVGASIEAQAELGHAEERAKIRSDAPRAVAQDQLGFLQVGLGQNPGDSMSNLLSNQSSQLQQQANIQEQVAGQAVGQVVGTIGKGVSDYFADQPATSSLPDYDPDGVNYSPVPPTK